jgi:hypothetical protein
MQEKEWTSHKNNCMSCAAERLSICAKVARTWVVMRADLFERIREIQYDGGPWTDEEMDMLAAEDADMLGWAGMEAYQEPQSESSAFPPNTPQSPVPPVSTNSRSCALSKSRIAWM